MKTKTPTAGAMRKVTADNLQILGAAKLADLLAEVAETRPDLKRRLRLELAAEQGLGVLAPQIDKRLNAYETSRGKVAWRQKPAFLRDLDALRGLIVERLAPFDAAAAAERLWRFLAAARQVQGRVRQRGEEVDAIYMRAAADLGDLLARLDAGPAAATLVEHLALHPAGWKLWLPSLLSRTPHAFAAAALKFATEQQGGGPGWVVMRRRLAEAAKDPDAAMATYSAEALKTPTVAAEVARQFLEVSRLKEAADILRAAAPKSEPRGKPSSVDFDWESAWIEVLERQGETSSAQAVRWESFQRTLAPERLRAYLARLADFDDVAAEAQAMDLAAAHSDFGRGLRFLMEWPALDAAGRMVEARAQEIVVGPDEAEAWAAKLRRRQPRAANLLLRRAAAQAFARREFKLCERLTEDADAILVE